MKKLLISILLASIAITALAGDKNQQQALTPLRIDSTFYYNGASKEALDTAVAAWLQSCNDITSGWSQRKVEADRIVTYSWLPNEKRYESLSGTIQFDYQFACRDGVVRVWFYNFKYYRKNIIYEQVPKMNIFKRMVYKSARKKAVKLTTRLVTELHQRLNAAFPPQKEISPEDRYNRRF